MTSLIIWLLLGLAVQTSYSAIHSWATHRQPDVKKLYRMNEEMVEKSKSLENSIKTMTTLRENEIRGGTFESIASSWGDDIALEESKTAYILAKTSCVFLDQCKTGGMSTNDCMKEMSSVKIEDEKKIVCHDSKYRSPDGSCNNKNHPDWGSSYSPYSRILGSSAYKDGIWYSDYGNSVHENPLNISSALLELMEKEIPDVTFGFSSWTKLVYNDLSHTPSYRSFFTKENIKCCRTNNYRTLPRYRHPMCFYMNGPDDMCVSYSRSMLAVQEKQLGTAEQMNVATHYLDASNIYGNTEKVQNSLRIHHKGKLKVPKNNIQEHINCVEKDKCFLTGDIRNLLDPSSAAGSLLLIKEHNRIAEILHVLNPEWDEEKLFSEAKRIVVAELQHITYNEWLPLVIGRKKYSEKPLHLQISNGYSDLYDDQNNPSVFNEFATAALIPLTLLTEIHLKKMNKHQEDHFRYGAIDTDMFKNTSFVQNLGKSLKMQIPESQNMFLDKMKSLFEENDFESDLVQTLGKEIHRGRDHGLLPFFKYGEKFNFEPSITEKNSELLKKLFKNQNHVDLMVGGILEKKEKKSFVGKTFQEIIARQMSLTRTGDKYFFDNSQQPYPFTLVQLNEIKKASFARLICDNFELKSIQTSAFLPQSEWNKLVNCKDEDELNIVDLRYWRQ